jgi:hypothetical protein
MTPEQFVQVVDAILAGKYSWACVLILRFAGYNPLHYIPYRTYNRLMKENISAFHRGREADRQSACEQDKNQLNQSSNSKIRDLSYLESLDQNRAKARGGDRLFVNSMDYPMYDWFEIN